MEPRSAGTGSGTAGRPWTLRSLLTTAWRAAQSRGQEESGQAWPAPPLFLPVDVYLIFALCACQLASEVHGALSPLGSSHVYLKADLHNESPKATSLD